MNADIRTITSILASKGVFDLACLLNPEAIVTVAFNLASMSDPNEYALWLGLYAARYQVSTAALTVDVLIVLSHSADFVDARIARAAKSELRQLAAA